MKKNKKDEAVKNETTNVSVERAKAIGEFNVQNMGRLWIDPEKVPTDEDIENAKKEFEDRTKALQDKEDYLIADKQNALRVAKFMKDFNDNSHWTNRMFVGVLRFSELMDNFIKDFDENNPVDLVLEYQPTQYAYLLFKDYGGVGIKDATHMAEIWDEYLPIFEVLYEHMEWYKKEMDMCNKLRDRWAMFEQGYYLYILEDSETDPRSTEDSSTSEA